ncbi:MAG TPA: hypothetical protein EYP14_20340 [Planctomycetaceae bacterium]|nr:hypothetical protein [Planctomycetaceae bacterium]
MARSTSLLYGLNGVATLILAADVRRYSPLVRLWGLAHLFGGVAFLAIDWTAGLPGLWTLGEGPVLIPIGVATLLLERRVRAAK